MVPTKLEYLRLMLDVDIDLKKAAKFFANKFATGSSVSKNPQGEDEIFIQGDVADEVRYTVLERMSRDQC